jgi:hypothetical protein
MEFLRTVESRGHRYRQRVEWVRDARGKRRLRIVQNLGPVAPIYRRPEGVPATLPMPPVHLGLLATRMMTGSLTPVQVVQTVQEMGEEMPPGTLRAAGIRFDLGEKTLELLLWLDPPSPHPRPAPSATSPSRSKGPTPRRSSRSKAPPR